MLLVIPARHQSLLPQLSQDQLSSLLQYYTLTAVNAGHRSGFAALADLGGATSKEGIAKLMEALERMQVRF